jgi:magnesium transporter
MSSTKFYHFPVKGSFYALSSLEDAIEAVKDDGFVWFNFFKPSRKELNSLIDTISIHPLSVEDCFDEQQVPKMEFFQNNTFIIFNSITYSNSELFVDEVDLFIGKKFLITVSGYNSDDRDPLNSLTGILENGKMNFKGGPDFLMHKVLDHIVDEKYRPFDIIEDELEEAEEVLLDDVRKFNPLQLMKLRRNLMSLRKSLYHEREILVKISRMDCPYISEKAIFHYRDIYDHLSKFFELTETYREIETSLMELYTSLLNNFMTKASNETNVSVRRLTMIATIFMPLTLIAGIGGMSEWTMMTGGPENYKFSYSLFILGMIVIAVLNYLLLKTFERKK